MPSEIDAMLQEMREQPFYLGAREEGEPEAPAPVAETSTEPPAVAQPEVEPAPVVTPQKSRLKLDDVILDDESLPPSLRGQSAATLEAERKRLAQETQQAGFRANRAEAERDMAFKAMERLLAQVTGQPAAPEKPQPVTARDRLRNRGLEPSALFTHTEDAMAATAEAGAEEAVDRIRPQIETVEQRVERIEKKQAEESEAARKAAIYGAYQAARPKDVSPERWQKFGDVAASYVAMRDLEYADPKNYLDAWNWYTSAGRELLEQPAPTPTPTAPPATPAAPPPPAGGGKPAAPPDTKPTAHLNNHQKHAASTISAVFKKAGVPFDADAVMDDVRKDPRTRSVFP